MVKKQCCAFVTFVKREDTEVAAAKLHRILELKGKKVHVMWGRPQQTGAKQASEIMAADTSGALPLGMPGVPGFPSMPGTAGSYKPYYPSMDPAAMGNTPLEGEAGGPPLAALKPTATVATASPAAVAAPVPALVSRQAPAGLATGTGSFMF